MKRFFFTFYSFLILGIAGIVLGVFPLIGILNQGSEVRYQTSQFKGVFSLLEDRLTAPDPQARTAVFQSIQSQFGQALWLMPSTELALAPEKAEALMKGEILILYPGASSPFGDLDIVAKRLGDTDQVIVISQEPVAQNEPVILLLFIFFSIFVLSLPALVWSWMLRRDLKKIRAAAHRFENGDHDVRVTLLPGSSLKWIASGFDRLAEQTQRLLKSHRDLSNNVSHEIRTPLARIKFSLEMMARDGVGNWRRNYLEEIRKDTDEIDTLVDDILTHARFESEAELSRDLTEQDIVSWLRRVIETEERGIPEKILVVEMDDLPHEIRVQFDAHYLQWAVRNLLRNAAMHARSRVRVEMMLDEWGVHIHVDDDGRGIPKEDYHRIFKPFVRLDKDRSRTSGGYGIGLALAWQITQWHKGELRVAASPLGGARFTLSLPRG